MEILHLGERMNIKYPNTTCVRQVCGSLGAVVSVAQRLRNTQRNLYDNVYDNALIRWLALLETYARVREVATKQWRSEPGGGSWLVGCKQEVIIEIRTCQSF